MRFNHKQGVFTDLDPHAAVANMHPFQAIPKERMDSKVVEVGADLIHGASERRVLYQDENGAKFFMVLKPYIHPAGSADISLGAMVDNPDGTRTWTPSVEGVGILLDGTGLHGLLADNEDLAGVLFTDYYTHFDGDPNKLELGRYEAVKAGDLLWVIWRGYVEVQYTAAAVAVGDPVVTAANGEFIKALAINTAGTIADYNTSLQGHLFGGNNKGVGIAKTAVVGAPWQGFVELDLAARSVA
ncbi:MAG: hypothetical protein CMK74_20305 [Pseudomonadales bacterium]|nr:hypothetical protein [Pseudomonadales bacterium]